jgi:hypothetical protein
MAYISGANLLSSTQFSSLTVDFGWLDLTLGMERLYWLARLWKGKAIARQDVVHAFTTYRASTQLGGVGHCYAWHVRVPSGLLVVN